MGALLKIRSRWALERARLGAVIAFGRKGAASPVVELGTDREILPYYDLVAHRERLAHRSVGDQLGKQFAAQARYPEVSSPRLVAMTGFRSNTVVRRCFDILCEHAVLSRPVIENFDGTRATSRAADRVRQLLEFPSGISLSVRGGVGPTLWDTVLWRFVQDLYNSGNGMLEWVSEGTSEDPAVLRRMRPDQVYLIPEEDGDPNRRIREYVVTLEGIPYRVPARRVFHMRFWDPLDDYFGIPPLFSARRAVGLDNELMDFSQVTMNNLGVPPYALEFDLKEMAEAQMPINPYDNAKDLDAIIEVRDKFTALQGGANRGKPAVAFGYKIRLLGFDMAKLDVAGLINMSESRIFSVHGVPVALGGRSARESDPTRSDFRITRVHFIQGTITSLLRRIEREFSPRLMSAFGPSAFGLRFRLDLSGIDVIREQRLRRGLEGAQVFMSGFASRGTCQDMAGWPQEGDPEEFAPLATASAPDRMPSGEAVEGTPP